MAEPIVRERDPRRDLPRRIALVITRSDVVGGAQVHVRELARALGDAGHTAAVFVGGDGPFVDQLRAADVPVWPLRHMVRAIDPRHDPLAVAELRTALRAFAPDLVSTHSTKAGWVGRVVARAMGIPVVVTAHGWLLTPGKLEAWQRAAWVAERCLAPLAARVITVSRYDRAIAREHRVVASERLRVVHNALPPVADTLIADPGVSPPKLIAVARFEAPKDPLTLVAALAELRDASWTCELIGDGPMRPAVERAIAQADLRDRVVLAGTRDDVPERLAAAQLFVLPSKREGFPISVLEAMRAGLPVVASDVGGIAEAVVPSVTGALVAPGDPADLARALAPLIREPERRVRMGEAGRRRFAEEFAFDTHLRRIWAVYVEAIDTRPRGARFWRP